MDYQLLKEQIAALAEGGTPTISLLSNVSAVLNEALNDINWVGFYLMRDGHLILGPFQGKVACMAIPVGRGVCGTAVAEKKTQLVPDVHQFPGHIACDCASNSEIVVPIFRGDEVIGVLDIDSTLFSRFSEEDKTGLEEIVEELQKVCNFQFS